MAREYTPEQLQIRSNCLRLRRETTELIRNKKWDLVQGNQCNRDDCTVCTNPFMSSYPLKQILMYSERMTLEIQQTIERIYGKQTEYGWFKMILENCPSITILSYFIENKLINPNYSIQQYTLLGYYSMYYYTSWTNMFEYLLSPEIGYDINIQSEDGDNCLLSIISEYYYDNDNRNNIEEREEENLLICNEKLRYLLERGADPLLQNKEGICALDYARNLETFTQEIQIRLVQLLEIYM
jgi:hypothetical protein